MFEGLYELQGLGVMIWGLGFVLDLGVSEF